MRLEDPTGGGQIFLTAWGEIQRMLGQLGAESQAGRAAIMDQGRAMLQRQDDLRRELLTHHARLERRVEKLESRKPATGALGWLRHLPWDRVVMWAGSAITALGWTKPWWMQWVKLLQ